MNFNEAEKYLLELGNLPRREYMSDSRHCGVYLQRLQFFLDLLGNPEKKIPHYIHVTGTSGKGSVCLMLHSILKASGIKTGLSISPHYSSVTERWQINGKEMSKTELTKLVTFIKPKITEYKKKSPYEIPSYFEILEAIGLLYFAQKKVQWAILEVGLGGRYDASNVIPYKDMAVITNIGLDHEKLIGPTKAKIAYEKAGIIKLGCKVFTMEKDEKMLGIIKRECPTSYVLSPKSEDVGRRTYDIGHVEFEYQKQIYTLPCIGIHQVSNAILCIEIVKSIGIDDQSIKNGLAKVKLPLRMEIVNKKTLIILDGAHNPDKMQTTVDTIKQIVKTYNPKPITYNLHLVIGFTADKNWKKMLKQLATLKPATIACTQNTNNNLRPALKPSLIAKECKRILPNTLVKVFSNSNSAYQWSTKKTKTDDILLITGSIFLSGELRTRFSAKGRPSSDR